jgi:hypothetical protein
MRRVSAAITVSTPKTAGSAGVLQPMSVAMAMLEIMNAVQKTSRQIAIAFAGIAELVRMDTGLRTTTTMKETEDMSQRTNVLCDVARVSNLKLETKTKKYNGCIEYYSVKTYTVVISFSTLEEAREFYVAVYGRSNLIEFDARVEAGNRERKRKETLDRLVHRLVLYAERLSTYNEKETSTVSASSRLSYEDRNAMAFEGVAIALIAGFLAQELDR